MDKKESQNQVKVVRQIDPALLKKMEKKSPMKSGKKKKTGQKSFPPKKGIPQGGKNRDGKQSKNNQSKQLNFPYRFIKRQEPEKKAPDALHDQLKEDRFDIAFDITWTTVTATALNPCKDESVPACCPASSGSKENEYGGYNNRWLMTPDNRLVISPFTVKSAIANGFANLMGSCYRVIEKVESHPQNPTENNYYYNGKYKRYRVRMNRSKPGIVRGIETIEDPVSNKKVRRIDIEPVEERLYKQNGTFTPGRSYYARRGRGNNLNAVRKLDGQPENGEITVIYQGPYRFGMDLELGLGDLGCKNHHRFYSVPNHPQESRPPISKPSVSKPADSPFAALVDFQFKDAHDASQSDKSPDSSSKSENRVERDTLKPKNDDWIMALVDEINFSSPDELKKKVYMGSFKPLKDDDPRDESVGEIWFEDLSQLKEGDWIYYHPYPTTDEVKNAEKRVENIGKNFQFKALFCHEDTLPENAQTCTDVDHLCPRCRLFGMTGKQFVEVEDHRISFSGKNQVTSLKGRFKSAALTSGIVLDEDVLTDQIPFIDGNNDHLTSIAIHQWKKAVGENEDQPPIGQKPVARQLLLPIQAAPKPNKRDENGYFDENTGDIKGAKVYMHEMHRFRTLSDGLDYIRSEIDNNRTLKDQDFEYAHRLRRYAQVCDAGIDFTGVVGVENANLDEVAALTLLLETDLGDHAYKLGLGKALGMGTVASHINTVWIRKSADYTWKRFPIRQPEKTFCPNDDHRKDGKSENNKPDNATTQLQKILKAHLDMDDRMEQLAAVTRTMRQQLQVKEGDSKGLSYPEPKNYWKTVNGNCPKETQKLVVDVADITAKTNKSGKHP